MSSWLCPIIAVLDLAGGEGPRGLRVVTAGETVRCPPNTVCHDTMCHCTGLPAHVMGPKSNCHHAALTTCCMCSCACMQGQLKGWEAKSGRAVKDSAAAGAFLSGVAQPPPSEITTMRWLEKRGTWHANDTLHALLLLLQSDSSHSRAHASFVLIERVVRVRLQLIRHVKTCTTDIYLHNERAHVGLSGHAHLARNWCASPKCCARPTASLRRAAHRTA